MHSGVELEVELVCDRVLLLLAGVPPDPAAACAGVPVAGQVIGVGFGDLQVRRVLRVVVRVEPGHAHQPVSSMKLLVKFVSTWLPSSRMSCR